jgi:xanthine/uracil permease
MIIAGAAAFDQQTTQYLVSTSLIVCGILSSVQITRFHIYKTPYYVGTGLISVVGTSFSMIPIATKGLAQMYANGKCPSAADGTPLPCPAGYGALLGTASLCSLLEIGLSFMTPKTLKKLFPPIVTGKRLYSSLPLASLLAPRDLFEKEANRLTSRSNRDAHWGGLGPNRFSGLGRGLRILHGPTYKW